MNINDQELFHSIEKTVLTLNEEMEKVNDTGIFFAPELAIAFNIGNEIVKCKEKIFGAKNIYWDRERDLKNGGPTDIIFEQINGMDKRIITVIELKLRDKYEAYQADIEKLMILDLPECNRYFCVLLDSFKDGNDERLEKLESAYPKLKKVNQKSFPVKQDWYAKQVYCVLNLYKVIKS